MTTLISWLGVDSRSPSSIYLASDSRISWGGKQCWDTGRKLFASRTMPEIFGYCGDVTFPIQVLGQIIEQIDNGLLFAIDEKYKSKLNKIFLLIKNSFLALPLEQQRNFEILYVSRISSRMSAKFLISRIYLTKNKKIEIENLVTPKKSDLIIRSGSGETAMKHSYNEWVDSIKKDPENRTRTSRNIFSAFCDSLIRKENPLSGGSPQLVGLYRVGVAKTIGIIYEGKRYLNGQEVKNHIQLDNVEWRNILFERCGGNSMHLLQGAQAQPRPKHIKS